MKSIEATISMSQEKGSADLLRQAEFLRQENDGRATTEVALLLAEAESKILQTPNPDKKLLYSLGELRVEAARDF